MRTVSHLLIALTLVCLATRQLRAEQPPQRDYAHLAALFSPPGTPHFADKQWITIEAGIASSRRWSSGWKLKEENGEIELYSPFGNFNHFHRPTPDDEREVVEPPDPFGGTPLDMTRAIDYSIAWVVTPGDYLVTSRKRRTNPPSPPTFDGYRYPQIQRKHHAVEEILAAARDAHFAKALHDSPLADQWYDEAVRRYDEYREKFRDPDHQLPFQEFLTVKQAHDWQARAVFSALEDEPREELLWRWQTLAAMPPHPYSEEAKEMVKQYELLIAEDAKWREPTNEQRANLTTDEQIDYWLYQLRDWDTENVTETGECRILGMTRFVLRENRFDMNRPNPVEELMKIGVPALPRLIPLMTDRRPTRCQGYVEDDGEQQYHLLRYGDCCAQIFELIAKIKFLYPHDPGACPTVAGQEKAVQRAAEKWWAEHQAELQAAKP